MRVTARCVVVVLVLTAGGGIVGSPRAAAGPPEGVVAEAAVPSAEAPDALSFANGDKLHGTLVSVVPNAHGCIWKHAQADKEIGFSLDAISKVLLGKRGGAESDPGKACLKLTNDDMLTGELISLDGEKYVLNTAYGGKIEVKRAMVRTVLPNAGGSSVVYEGPNDISEWKMNQSSGVPWKYKNGALYAVQTYPVGRFIEKIPDLVDIEFEIAWRYRYPSFYFAFFTDNIEQYYGSCYLMQVSGNSVYLQRYARGGSENRVGHVNVDQFANRRKASARFNLLVSKAEKSVVLMIDGQMIQRWTDGAPSFAGLGNGILFQPQNEGGMRVSGIRISEWDGKIPDMSASEETPEQDLIRFVNNDKVSGRLKSIADGKVTFETAYAPEMQIPLSRVRLIHSASKSAERARRNKSDIRASLVPAGIVTLDLVRMDGGRIEGRSENWGAMTIPLRYCSKLEFNIYREAPPEEDEEEWF